APVELVDIAPTLAETLELSATPHDFDGQSLWAKLAGKGAASQEGAYADLFETRGPVFKRSLYRGRWRANWDLHDRHIELYDKQADWAERHDVAHAHPEVADELKAALTSRTWRRAAVAFQAYERSRDPMALLSRADTIQQLPMVDRMLTQLLEHERLPREARAPLERLLERSLLEEPQRARLRALIARLGGRHGRGAGQQHGVPTQLGREWAGSHRNVRSPATGPRPPAAAPLRLSGGRARTSKSAESVPETGTVGLA